MVPLCIWNPFILAHTPSFKSGSICQEVFVMNYSRFVAVWKKARNIFDLQLKCKTMSDVPDSPQLILCCRSRLLTVSLAGKYILFRANHVVQILVWGCGGRVSRRINLCAENSVLRWWDKTSISDAAAQDKCSWLHHLKNNIVELKRYKIVTIVLFSICLI